MQIQTSLSPALRIIRVLLNVIVILAFLAITVTSLRPRATRAAVLPAKPAPR